MCRSAPRLGANLTCAEQVSRVKAAAMSSQTSRRVRGATHFAAGFGARRSALCNPRAHPMIQALTCTIRGSREGFALDAVGPGLYRTRRLVTGIERESIE